VTVCDETENGRLIKAADLVIITGMSCQTERLGNWTSPIAMTLERFSQRIDRSRRPDACLWPGADPVDRGSRRAAALARSYGCTGQ
jgi:hypothetical protein